MTAAAASDPTRHPAQGPASDPDSGTERDTARILARLQANLLATVARQREASDVGAFRIFVTPHTAEYLLNLATPTRSAAEWAPAISALEAAFAARGRRARLEYFDEQYPDLAPALLAAGYVEESVAPVMVLDRDAPRFPPERLTSLGSDESVPVRYQRLDSGDGALLDAFLAMQSRAYGMAFDAEASAWRPLLQAGLRDRTIFAAALVEGDVVVSGASLMLGGDCAELAGVATEPARQGRGLATHICVRLLDEFFAAAHSLCWLSAAEGAEGLYRRLGFRTVGTQRNFGTAAPA